MRTLSKKQTIVVSGVAAAALATSGVAYAYWTTGGEGTGTATTSSGSDNQLILVDASTVTPSDIAPGVTTGGDISVVVKNNHGTESYHVAAVDVSINSVTGPNITVATPCDATDYTMAGTHMTDGATDLAAGATSPFTGASIYFNDKATNQDGCKGATVHFDFAIS
jgi:hypothetical protein